MKYLFRKKNDVYKVFTPSSTAIVTYVERDEAEGELMQAVKTPGYQIVLYGHSGSGKSTLIKNKFNLNNFSYISTSCEDGTTIDSLILSAFDKLNAYYVTGRSSKSGGKISTELKASYLSIESKVNVEKNYENAHSSSRIVPIQLTPQRLSEFFGAANCIWVIEDFHKVREEDKKRLIHLMKIFMDTASNFPNTKVIAIGAVGSPREILNYDPELKNRVAEIPVKLMSKEEIKKIMEKGEDALNISLSPVVKQRVANLSNGLASVCHHLCLNMCLIKNVMKTKLFRVAIEAQDLDKAIQKYVREQSDTFKSIFDEAIKVERTRKFENGKLIIKALLSINKDEISRDEILTEIKKNEPEYPGSNLTTYLVALTTPEKGEIIRYDETANRYSFSNPFFKTYAMMTLEKELNTYSSDIKKIFFGENIISVTLNSGNIIINDR